MEGLRGRGGSGSGAADPAKNAAGVCVCARGPRPGAKGRASSDGGTAGAVCIYLYIRAYGGERKRTCDTCNLRASLSSARIYI